MNEPHRCLLLFLSVQRTGATESCAARSTVEENTMTDDPKTDDATPAEEAEEMKKVQEDAAREREENGGYQ